MEGSEENLQVEIGAQWIWGPNFCFMRLAPMFPLRLRGTKRKYSPFLSYFVVPENVHTYPKESLGKFGGREWGISKANISEGWGRLGSISTSHSGSGFLSLSTGSFPEQQLVIEPRGGL